MYLYDIHRCVEYLTDDTSNNYSENDIKNLAKEQWLLNDLKNICPGSLPPNLKNLTNTVLPGRYVLQINAAVDIGKILLVQLLCATIVLKVVIVICCFRHPCLPAVFKTAKNKHGKC